MYDPPTGEMCKHQTAHEVRYTMQHMLYYLRVPDCKGEVSPSFETQFYDLRSIR